MAGAGASCKPGSGPEAKTAGRMEEGIVRPAAPYHLLHPAEWVSSKAVPAAFRAGRSSGGRPAAVVEALRGRPGDGVGHQDHRVADLQPDVLVELRAEDQRALDDEGELFAGVAPVALVGLEGARLDPDLPEDVALPGEVAAEHLGDQLIDLEEAALAGSGA